jgi:hypothetical protein
MLAQGLVWVSQLLVLPENEGAGGILLLIL